VRGLGGEGEGKESEKEEEAEARDHGTGEEVRTQGSVVARMVMPWACYDWGALGPNLKPAFAGSFVIV